MPFPPQQIERIWDDEPMGKNDQHTLLGFVWRYWGHLDASTLWMFRCIFGWRSGHFALSYADSVAFVSHVSVGHLGA